MNTSICKIVEGDTLIVSICVEESELAELKKRAEESGLTFSRYLVEKGLDRI